uniref:Uncharacterized protein n=1 Tax=Kalanchoe fedtschenkoi TaxID=63787 RepID=A0A7N0ZV39_KALFE
MVLLNLITKKLQIGDNPYFHTSMRNLYEQVASRSRHGLKYFSLANEDFKDDLDFDIIQSRRVTRLAMQCIHEDFWERPTIGQVVNSLKKMKSARTRGDSGQIVNHVKKLETVKLNVTGEGVGDNLW